MQRVAVLLGGFALIVSAIITSPYRLAAAPPEKLYRVGMLERTPAAASTANVDAFRQGLRELGCVEGESFVIDYRSAARWVSRSRPRSCSGRTGSATGRARPPPRP